ncbi:hypothetical protein D558_2466 [Bordetella holmesii 44057]|nr:hypothetical protein D558_2466 [Bordetella holmesii 44057]
MRRSCGVPRGNVHMAVRAKKRRPEKRRVLQKQAQGRYN